MPRRIMLMAIVLATMVAGCQSGLSEGEIEQLVQQKVDAAKAEMAEILITDLSNRTDVTIGRGTDSVTTIEGSLIIEGEVRVKDDSGGYVATIQTGQDGGFIVWNSEGDEIGKFGRHPDPKTGSELSMFGIVDLLNESGSTGLMLTGIVGPWMSLRDPTGEEVGLIFTLGEELALRQSDGTSILLGSGGLTFMAENIRNLR